MYRLLITDGMNQEQIGNLRELGFDVIDKFYDGEELGVMCQDVDALVIRSKNIITKEIIDKAKEGNARLKLIIRSGVGLDNIDVNYATQKGIKVMNTPSASTRSVAELTIGQIITIARFVNISNVTMRQGEWNKKKYIGTEIYGKTLGIIGLGRIGKEVAKLATALGMKVIYYDILGKMEGYRYKFCEFEEVLAQADFLTIHIPYKAEDGYLMTKKEFNMMKDGAYFINHARGALVCEDDLIEVLDNGKIEAVAMDVYETEPKVNLKLINHPMVSPTPHIGASTVEAQDRISKEIVDILVEYFQDNEEQIAL